MRKILLVLAVPVIIVPVFAQKRAVTKSPAPKAEVVSSKPTKAQTMDWLAEKMKERLKAPRQFVSYSKGIFVYKKMYGATGDYCTSTLDLNKVTGMSAQYSVNTYITGSEMMYTACEGGRGNNYTAEVSIGGSNYQDYSDPFDFRTDNGLMERVTTAFRSLVDYNSSKKKEGEAY